MAFFILKDNLMITECSSTDADKLKPLATFENPTHKRRSEAGQKSWFLDKTIKLWKYDQVSGTLILPRGLSRQAHGIMKDICTVEDKRLSVTVEKPLELTATLRRYQEEAALEAIKRTQGIIEAPAGSGKTVTGVAITVGTCEKTLWITHKIELIEQTKGSFLQFSNIKEEDIGIIGGGKKDVGNILTIATIQTLTNILSDTEDEFGSRLKELFGCIIIDEAHHCPANTWHLIDKFPARYRIGLTATPYRNDGLDGMLNAIIGLNIYKVPKQELVKEEAVLHAGIQVFETEYNYEVANDNNLLLSELTTDPVRNSYIADKVKEMILHRQQILILTQRIEHTFHLSDRIKAYTSNEYPVYAFNSKSKFTYNPKEKKFIVVATFGKAEEGLDMPTLDTLIFATPPVDRKRIIQSIGRIERTSEGKNTPMVYDIFDDDYGILRGKFKKRYKVYRDAGYIVKDFAGNDYDLDSVLRTRNR